MTTGQWLNQAACYKACSAMTMATSCCRFSRADFPRVRAQNPPGYRNPTLSAIDGRIEIALAERHEPAARNENILVDRTFGLRGLGL
jgi:hypothetical protein